MSLIIDSNMSQLADALKSVYISIDFRNTNQQITSINSKSQIGQSHI